MRQVNVAPEGEDESLLPVLGVPDAYEADRHREILARLNTGLDRLAEAVSEVAP